MARSLRSVISSIAYRMPSLSEPGSLHAPVRHVIHPVCRNVIDDHTADLQLLERPEHVMQVRREDPGLQSVLGIIHPRQSVIANSSNGSIVMIGANTSMQLTFIAGCNIREHRWSENSTIPGSPTRAHVPLPHRFLDPGFCLFRGLPCDHRTHDRLLVPRIADGKSFTTWQEHAQEFIPEIPMDIHPSGPKCTIVLRSQTRRRPPCRRRTGCPPPCR